MDQPLLNNDNYNENDTLNPPVITNSGIPQLNEYNDQFLQSIRTPAVLRSVNPDAFTPLAVAIGPLHRHLCNDVSLISASSSSSSSSNILNRLHNYGSHHSFAEIERYKDMAVKALLGSSVRDPSNRAAYVDFIRNTGIFIKPLTTNTVPQARIKRFYSFREEVNLESVIDGDVDGDGNSDNHMNNQRHPLDLQSILIRDSCFVVEMMRSLCSDIDIVVNSGAAATPSAGEGRQSLTVSFQRIGIPTRKAVQLDLMLLENQVPLFVVKRVMETAASFDHAAPDAVLYAMVKAMATKLLPFCRKTAIDNDVVTAAVTCGEHLLDCLYRVVTAGSGGTTEEAVINIEGEGVPDADLAERSWWRRSKPKKYNANVPSATELLRAGVKFVGHSGSLRKVSLSRNLLCLPSVRVDCDSERMFRNLLAHETRGSSVVVLSYLHFMNGLINTAEDVAVLVKAGVLAESMGDHQSVAQMWNRLTAHAPCFYTRDYYDAAVKAHRYVESSVHVFMYEFQQEYLSRPWLVVSLLSAVALLVMTFVIMYYTILLYNHDTSQ